MCARAAACDTAAVCLPRRGAPSAWLLAIVHRRHRLHRTAAAFVELGNCALQRVELSRDGVEGHRGKGMRFDVDNVETVDGSRAVFRRLRVTTREGRPGDARAA